MKRYGMVLPKALALLYISPLLFQSVHSATNFPLTSTAMPISTTVITLMFTLQSGERIQASQYEGGIIRIEQNGQIYGFTPFLSKKINGSVAVSVYEIIRKDNVILGETIEEIKTLEVDKSPINLMSAKLSFNIQLLQVQEAFPKHVKVSFQSKPPSKPSICCVSCKGITTCACAVVASCGSCCAALCCP